MSLYTIDFGDDSDENLSFIVPFRPKKTNEITLSDEQITTVENPQSKENFKQKPINRTRIRVKKNVAKIEEYKSTSVLTEEEEEEKQIEIQINKSPLKKNEQNTIILPFNSEIDQKNQENVPIKSEKVDIPLIIEKKEPLKCFQPIPVPVKKKSNPIYRMARESSINFRGKRTFFTFFNLSEQLFTAKYKSGNDIIPIAKGSSVHVDGPMDACIIIGNKEMDFALRLNSKNGDEIFTVRFSPPDVDEIHRKMICNFFQNIQGYPTRLFSRQPTVESLGKFTFDFGGRFHLNSVKNAVLYEKKKLDNLVWIRKTGENVLEIEVSIDLDPLIIFTMGISSFITPIK